MRVLSVVFSFMIMAFALDMNAQEEEASQDTSMYKSIQEYAVFNPFLGGDSVRLCNGNPCMGLVKDYHDNGELKHKGYYNKGQLTSTYRNYFNNGQKERVFKKRNARKAVLNIYYKDGTQRSEITLWKGEPLEWTEYNINGKKDFYELYDKSLNFLKERTYYHNNGNVQSHMEQEDKDKHLYKKKVYYPNGELKAKGEIKHDIFKNIYQREGKWILYNKNGKPEYQQEYVEGKVVKEKEL